MHERDPHLPGSPPVADAAPASARIATAARAPGPPPRRTAPAATADADELVRPPEMEDEEWEDYLEFREFQQIGFRSLRANLERRRKKKS
jgi:hypothetical protein